MKYYLNHPAYGRYSDFDYDISYGGHKTGVRLSDTHACKECKQLFFTMYTVENCKEHLGVEPLYSNKASR